MLEQCCPARGVEHHSCSDTTSQCAIDVLEILHDERRGSQRPYGLPTTGGVALMEVDRVCREWGVAAYLICSENRSLGDLMWIGSWGEGAVPKGLLVYEQEKTHLSIYVWTSAAAKVASAKAASRLLHIERLGDCSEIAAKLSGGATTVTPDQADTVPVRVARGLLEQAIVSQLPKAYRGPGARMHYSVLSMESEGCQHKWSARVALNPPHFTTSETFSASASERKEAEGMACKKLLQWLVGAPEVELCGQQQNEAMPVEATSQPMAGEQHTAHNRNEVEHLLRINGLAVSAPSFCETKEGYLASLKIEGGVLPSGQTVRCGKNKKSASAALYESVHGYLVQWIQQNVNAPPQLSRDALANLAKLCERLGLHRPKAGRVTGHATPAHTGPHTTHPHARPPLPTTPHQANTIGLGNMRLLETSGHGLTKREVLDDAAHLLHWTAEKEHPGIFIAEDSTALVPYEPRPNIKVRRSEDEAAIGSWLQTHGKMAVACDSEFDKDNAMVMLQFATAEEVFVTNNVCATTVCNIRRV